MMTYSNYEHFAEIKHNILAQYPVTVRRAVCLRHVISVDHSVNRWLYERWVKNCTVGSELKSLHREMAQQITGHLDTPDVHIEFVHLDPRTTKHARASY
jgi:hypothetical protein